MLLGIDTASERIRLAVLAHGRAWTRTVPPQPGRSHSLVLLPALDALVTEAGCARADLAGVVCCVGPGGFTGLRTGVATAEGLALTGVPTWGFSSFALWAEATGGGRRAVLLDGQRGEAFLQVWDDGPAPALRLPIADLAATLAGTPWFAPAAFAERLGDLPVGDLPVGDLPGRLRLADEDAAAEAALAALTRRRAGEAPESPLVPFYLRETDAEAKFPQASAHLPESHRLGLPR